MSGRGASGNKRVWLLWDPPLKDGGRKIAEYEVYDLEIEYEV